MADERTAAEARKTARQEGFHHAENENVVQQAGASLGEGPAPIPTPGDGLTGKQAEREIGHTGGSSLSPAEAREMEARKTATESDALREQHAGPGDGDTDSKLEADKTQARVEGLIGNPD